MTFKTHLAAALLCIACSCVSAWKWTVWYFCWLNVLDTTGARWLPTLLYQHLYMLTDEWLLMWDGCDGSSFSSFSLLFFCSSSRPSATTSGQSTQELFDCRSQEKQTSVRWTWSCLFSYQPQVIDYKLTGWEHSVPGRCGRQDYSCHKCPVMQQSHKQFFFSAWSQWTAPLLDTPPPLLKPNACHSPCPHQLPAFPHVHKPTHVNTKRKSGPQGHGHLRHTADH